MATTTTTSQIDPTLAPYLVTGLEQAKNLFLTGAQPSYYPGQTYVSPSAQTEQALSQQEALARQQSPLLQQAQQSYQQSLSGLNQTAAGGFLNSNPYQQQMMQAATRPLQEAFSNQVLPGISSLYSKSGRLGSGSMEQALGTAASQFGRSMGDVTANLAGTQYQAERQLQQQAMGQQAQLSAAAPSIYAQQYLPSQQLAQIGSAREAISGQALQDQMARYNFQQQLPYQQLSGYLSSVYGSPMGGYGTQTSPTYNNTTTNALTGALAGGLGGYALGQAFPSLNFAGGYGTAGLGALAGGALGGLL